MQAADEEWPSYTVLVIECQQRINWYQIFEGCTLPNGCRVQVEQATLQQITMTVYPDCSGPLMVELAAADKPHPGTPQVRREFAWQFWGWAEVWAGGLR